MSLTVGIDPGITGAIAVLDSGGDIVEIHDMPTVELKRGKTSKRHIDPYEFSLLSESYCGAATFYVEQVSAMPGQGITSVFSFGRSFGCIEGVLGALEVPYSFVTPQQWTRDLKVPQGKDGHRDLCRRTWPQHADLWKRVKDDGRADAALIARWGWLRGAR